MGTYVSLVPLEETHTTHTHSKRRLTFLPFGVLWGGHGGASRVKRGPGERRLLVLGSRRTDVGKCGVRYQKTRARGEGGVFCFAFCELLGLCAAMTSYISDPTPHSAADSILTNQITYTAEPKFMNGKLP